jgi:hypothetical protein
MIYSLLYKKFAAIAKNEDLVIPFCVLRLSSASSEVSFITLKGLGHELDFKNSTKIVNVSLKSRGRF